MFNNVVKRAVTAIIFITMLLSGCSNLLTTVYVDPDDLRTEMPTAPDAALTGAVLTTVNHGAESGEAELSVQIQWSREVSGFDVSDLQLSNSVVSSFSGSGDTYNFVLKALNQGTAGFSVGEYAMPIEGPLDLPILYEYIFKAGALSLTITSDVNTLTSESSIPLYFNFSDEVENFDVSDILVLGGTLSGFTGSGNSYFGTLSFSADTEATISVDAGAANNPEYPSIVSGSSSFSINYDGSSPAATLSTSISDGALSESGALAFALDLSEELSVLDSSILNITNGSLSNFTGSGDSYTFDITPDTAGLVTVTVPSGTLVDEAGNSNGSDEMFSFTYDSSMVSVNLSTPSDLISNAPFFLLDITFGEDVTGLDLADFSVSNGSASNLTGSGETYQVEISPSGDGPVDVTITSGGAQNGIGSPNVESSFTFSSDKTAPSAVFMNLEKISAGTPVSGGDYSNEFLLLELLTDYSGDSGSDLSYEYTLNSGLTWSEYSLIGIMLTDNKKYSGINIRVIDEAGNITEGSAISNVTIDTVIPDAPGVMIATDPVNASNYTAAQFSLSGGEAGNVYYYSISSDKGGSDVTGSGTFDGAGGADITENLSSLNDGTLTIRSTQEDPAGNESAGGTDTAVMDTLIPARPSVTITSGDPITGSNRTLDFFITDGEEGIEYEYVITSTGGGTILDDTGIFDGTGVVTFNDMDVSAFRDGDLTVMVNQTDDVGNVSPEGTDSILLDMVAVNEPVFDFPINSSNVTNGFITIVGEPGSTYTYTIYSTGGGSTITDTAVFDASGEITISGIDFTGLDDGYLILSVVITDISGNSDTQYRIVEKDTSSPPQTTTADFSGETASVTFDMTYHGKQTVPSGVVKYDTTGLLGSDHDDIIKFAKLEAGETFTIDGGAGYNIIDLTNYSSSHVTVTAGQSGQDDGTIVLDPVDGGIVTINYTDFQKINFSSNNFTGSPHAIELDTRDGSQWIFSDTTFELTTSASGYKVGVIFFEGSLGLNYQLDTTFQPYLEMSNKNGLIIFDYIDADNYKYIRAFAKANKWEIGEVIDGTETGLASLSETIDETAANALQLRVTGVEGKTAELWSGDVMKASYTFGDVLNDGIFGLTNDVAHTEFTINMTPTNWAPYGESFEEKFSRTAMSEITIDIIGSSVDFEGEFLSISQISTSSNGNLVYNGDGTVTYTPNALFYGIDTYSYTISDGTNLTTAEIRIDVLP